jgi:hypothetical protein
MSFEFYGFDKAFGDLAEPNALKENDLRSGIAIDFRIARR